MDTETELVIGLLDMKAPERQHVSLRQEQRKGKSPLFVVTWTPTPQNRHRRCFIDAGEAETFANNTERTLQKGHDAILNLPKWRLVAINALCEMLPQDHGATLHKAIQFYIDRNGLGERPATAKEVGLAYIESRSKNFSDLHSRNVRSHVTKFIDFFGERPFAQIDSPDYERYLREEVGGAGKTQNNHLITLKSMSRWARDIGLGKTKFLPPGQTAVEQVQTAQVEHKEHVVYSPEQFMRLLACCPTELIPFFVLGQFAGIRAAERCRLEWQHWRRDEDNKLVLNRDVTKTKQRRRVDVLDNLVEWLTAFRGEPTERMVQCNPHQYTSKIAKAAGVPWIDNALRAGYASYHLELFDNAALTAKNDGHSVTELETTYKSISGVTKKAAKEMFAITPKAVIAFAQTKKLPAPAWASKI